MVYLTGKVRGLEEDNNLLRQRLANALFRIDTLSATNNATTNNTGTPQTLSLASLSGSANMHLDRQSTPLLGGGGHPYLLWPGEE